MKLFPQIPQQNLETPFRKCVQGRPEQNAVQKPTDFRHGRGFVVRTGRDHTTRGTIGRYPISKCRGVVNSNKNHYFSCILSPAPSNSVTTWAPESPIHFGLEVAAGGHLQVLVLRSALSSH